jgi:hypothetical protein
MRKEREEEELLHRKPQPVKDNTILGPNRSAEIQFVHLIIRVGDTNEFGPYFTFKTPNLDHHDLLFNFY